MTDVSCSYERESRGIAVAPLPAHAQATLRGEWRDDVERFANSLADAQLVPGMGIAVTQGDRVVYSRAFGFADAASGRRADNGTAFYIASSTKALTATAVLALGARRALDLDPPSHTICRRCAAPDASTPTR